MTGDSDTPRSIMEVVRIAPFRRLLAAQAISEIGDWATNVALILLIFRLVGHPGAAALVLLTKLVPRAVLYPVGGVLADRLDRRQLMIGADLARALLAASLLLVRTPEQIWWAVLATALAQVLASLFNPAAMAAVPALVPRERLGTANALIGGTREVSFFVGPLLGALVIGVGDIGLAFVLDAVSFLLSAVLLLGIGRLTLATPERAPLQIGRDLALGWTTVWQHHALPALFVAQALFGGLIAALNVLLVPLLINHWQAAESLLGTLYAAVGAGSLLGAVLTLRLVPARSPRTVLIALAVIGAATLGLGLTPWLGLALALLVVAGTATMIGDVATGAFIQLAVGGDRLGRVFGLLFWAIALGQVAGAGLGWLASGQALTLVVVGMGLATLAAALVLALTRRSTSPAASPLADGTTL